MTREELMDGIRAHLQNMVLNQHIKPEVVVLMLPDIEEMIVGRDKLLVDSLAGLVKEWEEAMGPDDKSLYSLGLRKAIDIIRNEEHKPLGEKDYRNNKPSTE